jgi:hypothetical protein
MRKRLFWPAIGFVLLGSVASVVQAQPAQRGTPFVSKLEQTLGRTITPSERMAIRAASERMAAQLRQEQDVFVASISKAVNLPPSIIRTYMPQIGAVDPSFDKNMIPKIEKELGRGLAPAELQAIREADTAKKTAMAKPRQEFAETVARTLGTTPDRVKGLLPKIGL